MIFHSFDFVAFLLLVVILYWRLPHRAQNALLLVSSYVFYGWIHPWFLALIFASTAADYWAGRGMAADPGRRRQYLWLSLVVNLGMLGFFKYFNFFADNVHEVLALLRLDVPTPALRVVLPVGISFYTFQELTYTIDVYKGRIEARRDFLDFAAFVSFFPQLVAGPIERAARLLPQMERPRVFSWTAIESAAFLIVWGYFKKLVVADNVGIIANKVFALEAPEFYTLWAGVFAFGLQIYADFSAYSDIARGVARCLGFELMVNFDHPYTATGPADFWRRWHISLSTWFRDYVYIPLGGSRGGTWRTMRNIMATFLLSGFWHGASWNYVMWGAFHGVLLVGARVMAPLSSRVPMALKDVLLPFRWLGMFVLVNVGWLLFRETDTAMLMRDLTLSPAAASSFDRQAAHYLFLVSLFYSLPIWVDSIWVRARGTWDSRDDALPFGRFVRRAALAGLLVAVALVFRSRQSLDFIYFQF